MLKIELSNQHRTQKPETRNQKPETRIQNPTTCYSANSLLWRDHLLSYLPFYFAE